MTQLVEPGFEDVAEKATRSIDKARGGALCVYHRGKPVVDIWTGESDPKAHTPWARDTMAMSWSTGKGVAAAAIHMLADRDQLDHDATIASYWPEFAAAGKQHITVRQVLAMEAGLYDVRHLTDDPRHLLNHDTMAAHIAAATPIHEPGTANAYHAMTFGWILGELVRRITGDTLGSFISSNIAEPLGIADEFFIGTPRSIHHRVAALPDLLPENAVVAAIAKGLDPITKLAGFSPRRFAASFFATDANDVMSSPEFLEAEVPSVNGVFSARALARMYAALGSDDGLDGVQLWSPATRRLATTQQNDRRDLVIPIRMGWQMGFYRPKPAKNVSESAFGFFGAYGSGAYADPDRQVAVGLILQETTGMPLLKLSGLISDAVKRL